jgi:hypothetical protein
MKEFLNKKVPKSNRKSVYVKRNNLFGNKIQAIKPMTAAFIDTLTNPMSCHNIARKPDSLVAQTVILKDYLVNQPVQLHCDSAWLEDDQKAMGFIIWIQWGQSAFTNIYDSSLYLDAAPAYTIGYSVLGTGGLMTSLDDADGVCGSIPPANYESIFNLTTSMRPIAAGIRLTPQIQYQTDSSTISIRKYIGACFGLNDLYGKSWVQESEYVSPINALLSSPDVEQFTNEKGCTIRLNTTQSEYDKLYTYPQLIAENLSTGNTLSPVCVCLTSQAISASSTSGTDFTFTFPVYLDVSIWIEAQLDLPSPVLVTTSPIDPDWEYIKNIINAMQGNSTLFPCIVEGHSFKSFYDKIGKFLQMANKVLNYGSAISAPIQQVYNETGKHFL